MNQKEFHAINDLENRHWWYIGMKEIWVKILPEVTKKNKFKNILDLGCGTGGNLTELEKFGDAEGLEYSDYALRLCKENKHKCFQGSVLDLKKITKKYQLVTIFDVLYQFEKDRVSDILLKVKNLTEAGGFIMIREPAFNIAFGRHDIEVGTKTRFTKKDFIEIFYEIGYEIKFITYLNFLLFLPIILKRKLDLFLNQNPKSDLDVPSTEENQFLKKFLNIEKDIILFVVKHFDYLRNYIFPFGISIFIIAQKKQ